MRAAPRMILAAFVTLAAELAIGGPGIAQTAKTTPPLLKFKTEVGEPQPWVKKTRPPEAQLRYTPLGHPRAEPPRQVLDRAAIMRTEAEMDGLRRRHDQISGRHTAPVALESAAGEPFVKKTVQRPRCVLTCIIDLRKPPLPPNADPDRG